MITGPQCFEARTLLKWSRDRLAPLAGLTVMSLRDFEIGRRDLDSEVRESLRLLLEQAGVQFTSDGDVKLRPDLPRDEGLRPSELTAENDD
jgi:hypothetical protein